MLIRIFFVPLCLCWFCCCLVNTVTFVVYLYVAESDEETYKALVCE